MAIGGGQTAVPGTPLWTSGYQENQATGEGLMTACIMGFMIGGTGGTMGSAALNLSFYAARRFAQVEILILLLKYLISAKECLNKKKL